ncbi:hypothetical protein [Sphingomonas abietis]|uniref:DUF2846 domain-containing protein n=1 Tax=Sphingomonas abietis TaxID=3012344 RepID=A0ABY7NNV3_9SPHN|nr:hypothetical protein [Sphingomonas abietis]WBO22318.1 hypothetical protein PBT88_19585 [Sphingomonas abietis]
MTKAISFALCGAFLLASAAQTQTSSPVASPDPLAAPNPAPTGSAKIIMYRGSALMGYALGCPIRFKGAEVVELGRGKFAEWAVPAGHYILTNKTASVDIR